LREGKKKSRAFFERGRALLLCGFDALSKIRRGYRFDRAPDPCGHTPLASDGRKRLWRHPETKEKASQIGGNALVKGEPFKKQKFLQKSVDRFYSLCYIITCSEPNGTVKTKRHGGIAQLGAPATVCDDPSTRGNDNLIKTPETQ